MPKKLLQKFISTVFFISLLIVQACAQKDSQVTQIEFELLYQGKKINCENLVNLPVALKELRFYIHDLKHADKSLSFVENGFQTNSLAYIDFPASEKYCSNSELVSNQTLVINADTIPSGVLSFNLGVPNNLNHQNPVKAKAPLNRSDMHWQWLSGYKFLRLEYMKNDKLNRLHLGSIGCSGRVPNNVDCKYPNRLQIQLSNFDLERSTIEVHIDELLKPESDSLCMGNPNEPHCQVWFNALQNDVFKPGTSK